MSSAKRPPSCLGLNESMSQWVNEAKNELMKPRLYLLWIHLCTFFPMFAIHMCEKICFFPEILVRHYVLCVCTCTNQLVLSTEVTRLNFLNSIVMGQINRCGFQSHVAIDRYCIFLEINTFELSWVELSYQYRKSHCGDKTILRPLYLHNGISYTGKTTSLYLIGALVFVKLTVSFRITSPAPVFVELPDRTAWHETVPTMGGFTSRRAS